MSKEILLVVDAVSNEKGVGKDVIFGALEAALASAVTFAVGAALPLLITWLSPEKSTIPIVAGGSLMSLALLGGLAAQAGGANIVKGAVRVVLWGALAMAATALIGSLFGTAVS